MSTKSTALILLDYRRRMADLYALARDPGREEPSRCRAFRAGKDALFASHRASPLNAEQKTRFTGLNYAPYDPRWRVMARSEPIDDGEVLELDLAADGRAQLQRVAYLHAELDGAVPVGETVWRG